MKILYFSSLKVFIQLQNIVVFNPNFINLYFTPKKETLGKLRGSKIVLTDTTEKKPFPWTGRYQFSISECK